MRIAFDIGGVLSKYPDQFRQMAYELSCSPNAELFIITDMHDKFEVVKQLEANGFGFFKVNNIFCADYDKHGELCKAVLLRDLKIDMFFDDFIGYTQWPDSFGKAPIRMLVMPDGFRPYWAPEWKCSGPDFGRRVYSRHNDKPIKKVTQMNYVGPGPDLSPDDPRIL